MTMPAAAAEEEIERNVIAWKSSIKFIFCLL
jgi:hypothetical protein